MGIKENFQQAVRELTGAGREEPKKIKPVTGIKNAVDANDTGEFPAIGRDAAAYDELSRKAAAAKDEYGRQQNAFNAGNYQEQEELPDTLINSNEGRQSGGQEQAPISFGSQYAVGSKKEETENDYPETDGNGGFDDLSEFDELMGEDDLSAIREQAEPAPKVPETIRPPKPSIMGGLMAEKLRDDEEQADILARIGELAAGQTPEQTGRAAAPSQQPTGGYAEQRPMQQPTGGYGRQAPSGDPYAQRREQGFQQRYTERPQQPRQNERRQAPSQPTYGQEDYESGYSAGYQAAMRAAGAGQQRYQQEQQRYDRYDRGYTPPPPPPQQPFSSGQYSGQADDSETTVISKNTVIDGNIRSFANMSVDGNIKGNVETTKDIDLNGKIVGNIACNNARMRTSQIQGNIQMKGVAYMERDTLLIGDMSSSFASVNGKIKGNMDISGKAELKSDAVVFGDISASTITVIDGAIIQGYVSTTFLNKEESKNIFPDTITIGD